MVSEPDRSQGSEGPEDPGRPEDARQPPTRQEVRDEIARGILRIYEESYGTGAARAEALVAEKWVIVVLDGLELLPNEKFLVENGEQDTVMQGPDSVSARDSVDLQRRDRARDRPHGDRLREHDEHRGAPLHGGAIQARVAGRLRGPAGRLRHQIAATGGR